MRVLALALPCAIATGAAVAATPGAELDLRAGGEKARGTATKYDGSWTHSYAYEVQGDNPTAYYRLNDSSGTTMTSETGTHGTFTGSFNLGQPGALVDSDDDAVSFAGGGDDGANIPLAPHGSLTLELWVKTTMDTGNSADGQWYNGASMLDGEISGTTADYGLNLRGGKAAFGVGNPDTTIFSTTDIDDGDWHHVVATRTLPGHMSLYVDGVLEAEADGPPEERSATTNLHLAKVRSGSATSVAGTFDEVAVYHTTLNAAQVASHYEAAGNAADVNGPLHLTGIEKDLAGNRDKLKGLLDYGGAAACPNPSAADSAKESIPEEDRKFDPNLQGKDDGYNKTGAELSDSNEAAGNFRFAVEKKKIFGSPHQLVDAKGKNPACAPGIAYELEGAFGGGGDGFLGDSFSGMLNANQPGASDPDDEIFLEASEIP